MQNRTRFDAKEPAAQPVDFWPPGLYTHDESKKPHRIERTTMNDLLNKILPQ